jgi:curli production assembly/transport component CsgG
MAVSITRALITLLSILLLTGCAGNLNNKKWSEPTVARNPIQSQLDSTPHLDGDKITIAVYGFQDKTGQRKSNDKFSVLSSAVTQGSEVWVIDALKKIGGGTWFQVVERVSLDNLVKERQLIRSTREVYEGQKAPKLKPMLFAGILLEGGVVGYDSNIESGGKGARYLGIGASTQYRVDQVTVSMRIISVQTGEVLLTVAVEKRIASHRTSADIFRFVDMGTNAVELEAGSAINEPVNYAVRAAIESSVVEIVKQGEEQGLWKYKKLASDKVNEEKSKNENNN